MKLAMPILALLLWNASASAHDDAGFDSWSWCMARATTPSGTVRYFSDPFEGEADADIRAAYAEYLRQAYGSKGGNEALTVTCRSDASVAANRASLSAARMALPGVTDVTTGWRFHFE